MNPSPRASAVPRASRFERPRPQLLVQLSETIDVPLIVLAAPSGYGKTTLLAQYARSTTRRVAWCRVSGGHEGPAEVVASLAASLPEDAGLKDLDPRTPSDSLARHLASALADLDEGMDLIVDNVEDEALARWLGRVADLLEEGHRILMSAYTTDGLRLARRLADGQALVLDASDLAFGAEETHTYLETRGSSVKPDLLLHLAGWPAGLALSAHGVQRHADVDDLVVDALDVLPTEVRSGLPALAPLPLWSEVDAARLAPELPSGWLQTVQRTGLPVSSLGGGMFQPHQLLTRVLNRQLEQRPEDARAVRGAAARMAEAAGDLERACALFVQTGEFMHAVRLAGTLVPRYRDRGEHRFTRALLGSLPPDQLPDDLRERLAWAQIETGASSEGEHTLQRLLEAGRLSPVGLASLAMVRGRQGQVQAQFDLARQGLEALGTLPPVPALFWPFVHAALQLGRHLEAEQSAGRFVQWAEGGGDRVRLAEAWQLQALVWRRTRTTADAARLLTLARQVYEDLGWQGRAAAVRLDELELAVSAGQLGGVAEDLRTLEHAFEPDQSVYHVKRLRLLGTVERRQGRPELAGQLLRSALDAAQRGGLDPAHVGIVPALADSLLQQGLIQAALDWLNRDVGTPDTLAGQVLLALATGCALPCSVTEILAEPDAETRLRAVLLKVATDPDALGVADEELRLNPHAQALRYDLALQTRLGSTPVAGLLTREPVPDAPITGATLQLDLITLGDVQVHLNGQPIIIGLAKARELLVWLAVNGSGSRDELVTALWDGSAEERHVEYFRVAVRRLRGALKETLPVGLDPLPYAAGRYRLDPSLCVSLDVLATPDIRWLRPFLPGTDTMWVQTLRQDLAGRAVTALLDQAAAAPPAEAAERYRQMLSADPLLAPAHEALIDTLLVTGETGQAGQALQAYAGMLRQEYSTSVPARVLNRFPDHLTERR